MMSEIPDYTALLTKFARDVEKRIADEQVLATFTAGPDANERQSQAALDQLLRQRDEEQGTLQAEYESVRSQASAQFESDIAQADQLHASTVREIEQEADQALASLERQREDSEWIVSSVLDDSADDSPLREFEKFKTLLQKAREEQEAEWSDIEGDCRKLMEQRGWDASLPPPEQAPPKDRDDAQTRFHALVEETRQSARKLRSLLLPKLFIGMRPVVLFAVLACAVAGPVFLFVDPSVAGIAGERMDAGWIGIAAGAGAIGGLLLTVVLYTLGSMRQSEIFRQMQHALADAQWLHQQWLKLAKGELERRQKESEAKHKRVTRERDTALQRYEQAHASRRDEIEANRNQRLQEEQERHTREREQLVAHRDEQLALLDAEHERRIAEVAARWEAQTRQFQEQLSQYSTEKQRTQAEHWMRMKSDWQQACESLDAAVRQAEEFSQRNFLPWNELADGRWEPPREIPTHLRFGEYAVHLDDWEGAVPEDMRLAPRNSAYRLPATLAFPNASSVLLETPEQAARTEAIRALQTLMLRLLTLVPPGKLRFTIIDPVGLGESFGGFMHLTDFDELMVTSRIWTESGQIEARLADLSEHMENVFQKYLRNEFQTIEEYNESAGEVAEPYHFLVISDFPSKFSEIAARRLTSIVHSGPRCGVYTLMSLDPAKQLPNNFELADLKQHMHCLAWRDGAFRVGQALPDGSDADSESRQAVPDLPWWPIRIDPPPEPELFTSIVRRVGDASKDARRVEVAFDRITPDPQAVWSGDSRSEIAVPLGRAGATKLQQMRLGRGTSQHMLVAGKTGSGKSTFLHILITNLALHYSPDEVNFYLIDFKKGVEFKDYATYQLPHARVVAIESDREFGISALQRLDEVLQERGELFRKHGVQDIAGFRNANPDRSLPRILLIVDEFQEFFIEDDKLSQTASLLLDRLVRQGRAFGIHVILGSQTLGGAYSLARSTLGQVAVRVALQCSESDAHLILSEENTAARLLTRPGEAIYNDANGMMEGNHPFQIAWLSDDERERSLQTIQQRLLRSGRESEPPIVFEGNIPSDLTRNPHLNRLAREFATREEPIRTPTVWLGDAVEIKPPTAITFKRQSGTHVLIVGQDADAAEGIMAASLLTAAASLAARVEGSALSVERGEQHSSLSPQPSALSPQPSPLPSLFVLDGYAEEADQPRIWKGLAESLPVDVRIVPPRRTQDFLEALTAELKRREQADSSVGTPDDSSLRTLDPVRNDESVQNDESASGPILVFVDNISRFRDLRKAEDDFGLGGFGGSSEEKPTEPGKLFADLLSQGPAVGIHFIIWCDSYNNVDRWFSRQMLRELELRIAFQMNASDSSNLIDSPVASRLGTHRALLYREETGLAEKFRPYGLPDEKWLELFVHQMTHGPEAELATDLEEFSIL
jgi:DNA segregation ATPase FtsK/SpoIIIE, S-DNA-T family